MLSVSLFVHKDTEILGKGTKAPQSFLSDVTHPVEGMQTRSARFQVPVCGTSLLLPVFPRDSC